MTKTLVLGTALAAVLVSAEAFAQEPTTAVGGAGESCRARSDCKAGLKCVNQTCADEREGQSCAATADCGGELKCIAKKCTSGATPVYSDPNGKGGDKGGGGGSDALDNWMAFRLEGVHPFVGLTWAGGFDTGGITGNGAGFFRGNFSTFDGSFLFALHGGVFIDKHQLTLEVAPFTYLYDGKGPGTVFEMNGSYAYFIPIYAGNSVEVYWPLRIGVGIAGGDNAPLSLAFFQVRGDVVGAAIKIGHIMIDLHLPTFRYAVTDKSGTQLHFLDWMFGSSVSYVF